jgi:OOP family OmpA-OmpF porin
MKIRQFTSALVLSALAFTSFAQDAENQESGFTSPKKGSLIGFSANITDYSASIPQIGKMDIGASIMFWQGLTNNLDLSIRYNSVFTDYALPERTADTRIISELEGALHLRALSDDHLLNPFISAGIGVGRYNKSFVPYAPVGIGVQMNFNSENYIFLQGNYRFSFQDTKLDNNTFYSLGFATTIGTRKPKTPPPPPVPVDTDGDGTPDVSDECPALAGKAALNGCPDSDGDGIADKNDKCPTVAGVAKYNGCPIPDGDNDGVNDDEDACPTVVGLAKYKGCPIPDSDGDGVNDEEDRCPTVAGSRTNRGCPEVKEDVRKRLSFAATAIQFETGKSAIKKTSNKILDEIVNILNEYPDYYMTIDGHTDNTGNAAKNLELSKQRANAVKEYFVSKGIEGSRIETDGHGDTQPKASNKTAKGRAQNRRVDMDLKLK